MNEMKIKQLLLLAGMVMMLTVISCGDGGGGNVETQKEITITALEGTWTIDAAVSSFGNTELDGSDVSVTFTETGYTFTGAITTYVSGGTYVVGDDGSISDVTVSVVPDNIELDAAGTINMNDTNDEITVAFSVKEASGRVDGLGSYQIVFKKQ